MGVLSDVLCWTIVIRASTFNPKPAFMAHVTSMIKLKDLYLSSPHLIEHFYSSCENILESGKNLIFTAGSEEGRVLKTVDDLVVYRKSIEVGGWPVFD